MPPKKPKPAKDRESAEAEDEEIVVLCFKVLMMPRASVPGCSKVPCGGCGQMVWISPATAAQVAGKPHRISCPDCAAKEPDDDIEVMPPSEGQIAEMIENVPSLTPAKIRRKFPTSNPTKRKATYDDLIRRTKVRKRRDN